MSKTSTPEKSSINLPMRLRTCFAFKATLLVGLTILFCVPYIYLAHHAFFPVHDFTLSSIDKWAGFDTRWVWVYQSIYLLTGSLPWLATHRTQLWNYVYGFSGLVIVCFAIYLFLPIKVPRPPVSNPTGMYALLLFYDGPYNAFPSLHAGFLYYTFAFAVRVYGRPRLPISIGLITWAILILWATLATKEHYFVDLAAGIMLAAFFDAAAWSRIWRRIGSKSHEGSK